MAESAPNIVVLAGPNGAGKSTSAPSILRDALGVDEFVNADVIAGTLGLRARTGGHGRPDRKSTRLNSSHMSISYAVFCLKKKKKNQDDTASGHAVKARG